MVHDIFTESILYSHYKLLSICINIYQSVGLQMEMKWNECGTKSFPILLPIRLMNAKWLEDEE